MRQTNHASGKQTSPLERDKMKISNYWISGFTASGARINGVLRASCPENALKRGKAIISKNYPSFKFVNWTVST